MADITSLREHAKSLAVAFNIKLLLSPAAWFEMMGEGPAGYPPLHEDGRYNPQGQYEINTYDIIDERTYAIALHELGHALAPGGFLRWQMQDRESYDLERAQRLKMEEENAAWEWAIKHALYWSPEMHRALQEGIISYERTMRDIAAFKQDLQQRRAEQARKPKESLSDFLKRMKR